MGRVIAGSQKDKIQLLLGTDISFFNVTYENVEWERVCALKHSCRFVLTEHLLWYSSYLAKHSTHELWMEHHQFLTVPGPYQLFLKGLQLLYGNGLWEMSVAWEPGLSKIAAGRIQLGYIQPHRQTSGSFFVLKWLKLRSWAWSSTGAQNNKKSKCHSSSGKRRRSAGW